VSDKERTSGERESGRQMGREREKIGIMIKRLIIADMWTVGEKVRIKRGVRERHRARRQL
jgi:hypothetical protein